MALILIFVGSFIGVIVAAVQMLFQDASFWGGFTTYLAFSLGFPLITGVMLWAFGAFRAPESEAESYSFHEA